MARTKTLGANLPVPQSRDEAAATITAIGDIGRSLGRLEADMNDQLAEIKTTFEHLAEPLRLARQEKTEGLKMWAEANRVSLTGGDKTKTVDLGTGLLRWRRRPPSVRLTKVEDIIERLKVLGLRRFLRIKEEVDREAMQREPEVAQTIAGVSIGSAGEDFVVEPYEAELAEQAAGGQL
jgi:phage host-nuclease inhibitor protein Gam